MLSQADIALDLQDWELAKEKLEAVLILDPEHAQAQVKLTIAERKLRENTEQKSVDEKAKHKADQERKEKVNDLLAQGKEMLQNRNWLKAVRKFEQLLDLAPAHVEAQQLLADADAQIDREKEKQIEKQRQEKIDGLVIKGKEHIENHDWAQAIRAFEQALGLDTDNVEALALLAEAKKGDRKVDTDKVQANKKLFSDFVNCPNCGADTHRSFIICTSCGYKLGQDTRRSTPQTKRPLKEKRIKKTEGSRQSTGSSLIVCQTCNEENSNRSLYCYNCGSKL